MRVPPNTATTSRDECLIEIYRKLRPGDPPTVESAEALLESLFFDRRRYDISNVAGSIASAAQLGKLGRYVDKLLHQIAREVRDGNIDADPCCRSEEDSYCQFCDWASACHFQDGRDGDHLHYIQPVTQEEFWDQMDREGGD